MAPRDGGARVAAAAGGRGPRAPEGPARGVATFDQGV